MAARRYYYADSITDFLSRSNNEIVGALTLASQHDVNDETSKSWVEEIETMREVLGTYEGKGGSVPPDPLSLLNTIKACRGCKPL